MTFFEAVISGIVQGVTEFLPVSSSGHLVILHRLIGLKEPQIIFDIYLHLGTLAAVFVVFRKDIIASFTTEKKVGVFVLLGSIATLIFVLFFNKRIETAFNSTNMVGAMLILTGVWLMVGSFFRVGARGLSGAKAVLIGLVQGIAAIPGISRSGATISTGLFLGLEPSQAVRFSFLLSIPAIIGAFLFKLKDVAEMPFSANHVAGLITSCIIGVLALRLLLRVIYRKKLHLFGIYCILAGLAVLLFL